MGQNPMPKSGSKLLRTNILKKKKVHPDFFQKNQILKKMSLAVDNRKWLSTD